MDLSEYIFEPLRKHKDFILYRGRHRSPDQSVRSSILLMAPMLPDAATSRLRQAEHESFLRSELETASCVLPIAVAQYDWRPVLVLENPGGEFLDALVRKPIDTGYFLRIALEKAFEEIKRANEHLEGENVILRERADDPNDPALEIKRLQRCMNDLIDVLALPAAWRLCEPAEILSTFADSLMGMLTLDFFYARVIVEADAEPLEVLRAGPSHRTDEIAQSLDDWLKEERIGQPSPTRRKIGRHEISIFPVRMGVEDDLGLIVTGSLRLGFPDQAERVVLSVAANQTAAALQQALFLSKQKGVASELDQRVAERTRELAESNEELQLQVGLLQHLPVSAWTLKPDGTPDFVNRVWLEFSGQTLDFVRSHQEAWMTAVHPEDREIAARSFWEGVRSGQGFAFETRSLRAGDGTYRWHLQQAVVLRDTEGKVLKFVGTTTDIHDQKRAEQALRASEANLRQMIDNMPGLVSTLGPNGETQLINRQILEYFGKTPEELRNWRISDAIHPDDLPRIVALHAQSIKPGVSFGSEYRLRRADGVYRWFHFRAEPVRDAAGRVNGWYVLATDIDDRKQAEEALQASERNFASIINTIPTLAWSARPDGYCDFLNQSWLDFTGLAPEQAHGWGWSDAIHPEDRDKLLQYWQSAITSGVLSETEARMRRFDGVYRWTLIRANPWRDESGSIVKWYGTNTDIDDRKRAEEALRASEANLRRVIDTIPTLSWCNLADGPNEFLSKSWHEYTGLSPEEAHGWGWSAAFHPDDLPPLLKSWQDLLISGEPGEIEARLRRYDGAYRWFLIRVAPFRDESGKILRWYGTSADIHDRKLAEDELKRSEARYRIVIEAASDAVVSIDESGVIILANPATKRMFGYDPEWLIGKNLKVLMPGAMRELFETSFKRFLETGARKLNWQGTEVTALRANGAEFPVEISFGEITANGRKVFTGFIRDISEKKRAEEAVLASQRSLRLTIDTMPVLSWTALPDGTAEFFNKRWLDYTGLSLEEAQGQGWAQAFHPDDLNRVNDYWRSHILSGEPGEVEARLRRFDGSYRWFLLRGNPLRDESGAIVKWYGTNTDIDDRKRAEEELTRARAELAHVARVTSLGVLTASIAHEVNQPLSGIVMNAGTCLRMLDSDPANIEGAREAARRMIRDGNRASEVVTRLRALFKGKEVVSEWVNLNDAAQEVIALSLSELESKRIIVRHEFAENLPAVKGDRIQLQQVIQNLLRNAADALSSIEDRPRQLLIRTERDDGTNVQLIVQDAGIGIDPEAADRLFDPFYTTKEDGTGIGLSVSRSIVEAHRGRIWATANDGPGSSFIFSIPSDPGSIQSQGQ